MNQQMEPGPGNHDQYNNGYYQYHQPMQVMQGYQNRDQGLVNLPPGYGQQMQYIQQQPLNMMGGQGQQNQGQI